MPCHATPRLFAQGGQRSALPKAQSAAIAALDGMCSTKEDIAIVVDGQGIDPLIVNLNSHANKQTLRQTLSVLSKAASMGHAKALISAKVLAGLTHINTNHRDDKYLRAGVSELLDALKEAIDVDAFVDKVAGLADSPAVKFKQLSAALMTVSVLTYSPSYADQMAAKIIPVVVTALNNAFDKDTGDSAPVVGNALLVLIGLNRQCDILNACGDAGGLVRAVTKGPCEHTKMEGCALLSLELLANIASRSDSIDMVFDGGVVSACKTALTAHRLDPAIATRAATALLKISKHAGCIHIVQQVCNV
jgi:hypothetical protein